MKKLFVLIICSTLFLSSYAGVNGETSDQDLINLLVKVEKKIQSLSTLSYQASIVERISKVGFEGQEQGKEQVVDFTISENSDPITIHAKVLEPRKATVTYSSENDKVNVKPLIGNVSPCHGLLLGDGHTPIIYAGMRHLVGSLTKLLDERDKHPNLSWKTISETDESITVKISYSTFNPKARQYVVKSSDKSLSEICLRENVPIQTTLENNGLNRKSQCSVEVGQKLVLANAPFKETLVVLSKTKLLPLEITVRDDQALPLAIYKHDFK